MTDEMYYPGGVYYEGQDGSDESHSRTDVSLQGVGKGDPGNPLAINLNVTTGSCTFCLCSTLPDDMIRLAKWMAETAEEIKRDMEYQKVRRDEYGEDYP